MNPRLNIVTLGVSDVAASKSFYGRLGLVAHSMSNDDIGFFDINGIVLAVFGHGSLAHDSNMPNDPQPRFRGVSLAWNGTSPEDVDAILQHAVAAGATLAKPAEKVFWGGYSGYFADPDGHLWEVAYNPFVTFDESQHLVLP